MTVKPHEVHVISQGKRVPGWKSYNIVQDVLQPANEFSLEVKFDRDVWKLLDRDVDIQIFLDSTRILSGFLGRREKVPSVRGGTSILISGRDKTGRLVDESAPLLRYGGLRIKELAEVLVGDLFEDGVRLKNTDNRFILRNVRARQAKVIREPVQGIDSFVPLSGYPLPQVPDVELFRSPLALGEGIRVDLDRFVERPPIIKPGIFKGRQAPKKVPIGASRWQVLEEILSEARLMAWSSPDGRTLFVGLPAYDQPIQYLFYEPGENSGDRRFANAKISVIQDIEDMYSAYTAVGAAKGNGANYGPNVTKNRATVFDNPENRRDGTGINFRRRKFLLISDDGIKNQRDALERAEREKLEREVNFWEVSVEASGHSQVYGGEEPTLYTVDTICRVMDFDTGIGVEEGLPKDFYITRCEYGLRLGEKTQTRMKMVPKGTLLVT